MVRIESPWFVRGGGYYHGSIAGIFGFSRHTGGAEADYSFRTVVAVGEGL